MALTSIPTRSLATIAGGARRVQPVGATTELVLDDGRRVTLACRPDLAGARRCRRSLNHLVSVRIEGSAERPVARLRGVGNRLPVLLTVPVSVALALIDTGVPAVVHLTEAVDA
jgi:hypothetical protein